MLKKIIAVGLISIMGIMVLCGCNSSNLVEEKADFVELNGWSIIISYYHNRIESICDEPGARLTLSVDKGEFYVGENANAQTATLNYGELAAWTIDKDEVLDIAYIDVMVKVRYCIIGYAVIKITNSSQSFNNPNAEVIKSVSFPKINGKYQKVSIFEVRKRIAAAKK